MPVFSTVPYLTPDDEEEGSFGASLADAARQPSSPDDNDSAAPLPAMAPAAPMAPAAAPAGGGGLVPAPAPLTAPKYVEPDRSKLQDWENRRVQDSAVSSGPKVSPRWWERALGGVAAGAAAFGHVPGAVELGQNITNRRFNQAENERAGRLDADQAGIQAEQGNIAAQQNQWEQGLRNFNANVTAQRYDQLNADRRAQEQARLAAIAPGTEAPDDPNNPLGTWHATTVGGQVQKLQGPPDRWTKTPAGVAAQREADVKRLGLAGDDAKFYRANGKLKEPNATTNIHVPSAESQAYNDTLAAWKRENPGKQPTTEDMRTIRAAASGREVTGGGRGRGPGGRGTPNQFKSLDKETAALYSKAEAEYQAALAVAETPQDREAARADLEAKKVKIGADHSDQLRDLGGIPAEDSQQSPAAPAAPAPKPVATPAAPKTAVATAQQTPQKIPNAGKVFTVNGKKLTVGKPVVLPDGSSRIFMGVNPQTGKAIVQRN